MSGGLTATRSFDYADPRWPGRFKDLCLELRRARDERTLGRARGEVWLLLNSLISQYLRFHATRQGRIAPEDLEDIAAAKSSDLLHKIEIGAWDAAARDRTEVTGFLSKVARNGLVDRLREMGRQVNVVTMDGPEGSLDASSMACTAYTITLADPPDRQVERKEFVVALRNCVGQMEARSRRVWFLRVLCGLPSRGIATHPQVSLTINHVDAILHRARKAMRGCMHGKGYEPRDMPLGTFTELWKACQFDEVIESMGADT